MKHWLTAALICFGSSAHALSVETQGASVSTTTVSRDVNSNIVTTYGVSAATAVITYVQASSITTTAGINTYGAIEMTGTSPIINWNDTNASGLTMAVDGSQFTMARLYGTPAFRYDLDSKFVGVGTDMTPASKLHMSSGTLTVDGTGAAMNIAGSTFTVAASGIVSAPSQPGARVDTLSMANAYIQRGVFWQLYWTNSSGNGSYNQNSVFKSDAVSSDTFKARGAGLYYVSVKIGSIPNTGTNATMKVYISVNGSVKSEKMNVPAASGTWSATCEDYLLLADGDNVTAKVYSDDAANNPVPTNNNTTNSMVLQKIW